MSVAVTWKFKFENSNSYNDDLQLVKLKSFFLSFINNSYILIKLFNINMVYKKNDVSKVLNNTFVFLKKSSTSKINVLKCFNQKYLFADPWDNVYS